MSLSQDYTNYLTLSPSLLFSLDIFSSDPYVLVQDGKKEWHRTSFIPHTLNPVWTLSTGSLFLIQTTLTSFFESANYMEFIVKDYDSLGDHEVLGTVMVSKKEMLNGTGDRNEYELSLHSGKTKVSFTVGKKVRVFYDILFTVEFI
jgi:hypothetical protein